MIVIDPLDSAIFTQLMAAYEALRKPEDPDIDPSLHEDIFSEVQRTDAWVVHEVHWHGFVVLIRDNSGLLLSPYFFGSIPMIEAGYEVLLDPLMEKVLLQFEQLPCHRLYTIISEQARSAEKERVLKIYGIDFDYEYVEMQLKLELTPIKLIVPDRVQLKHVSAYALDELRHCFDEAFASSDVKYYYNMSLEERKNFFEQVYLPGVYEHPCSLAIETEGHLVGFCLIMTYHGQAYITSMCISEPYRCAGFGRYLLGAIIEEAKTQGYTTIGLGTEVQMKAYKLYSAYGFEKVASKKYYLLKKNG